MHHIPDESMMMAGHATEVVKVDLPPELVDAYKSRKYCAQFTVLSLHSKADTLSLSRL